MTSMIRIILSPPNCRRSCWRQLVLAFLIMGVTTTIVAKEQYSRKVQRLLYNAQKAQQEEKPDEAIGLLESYLNKKPENPPVIVYSFLGSLYHQTEKLEKAHWAFTKGFALKPDDFLLCRNLAIISYQLKQIKKAAAYFEKAYELNNRQQHEILYQAATLYYFEKQYKDTIRLAKRHIESHPSVKRRWIKLIVHSYLESKNKKKAESTILAYLKRYPGDAAFWQILAGIQLEKEDYLRGAASLEIYLRLAEPKERDWVELGDIYMFLNAPLKAAFCYQKSQSNSVELYKKRAAAYTALHRYDMASKMYSDALLLQPDADLFQDKGRLFYDNGQYHKSIKSLSKSLELKPEQEKVYLMLGNAALEVDDWKTAKKAFVAVSNKKYATSQAVAGLKIIETLQTAKDEAEQSALDLN